MTVLNIDSRRNILARAEANRKKDAATRHADKALNPNPVVRISRQWREDVITALVSGMVVGTGFGACLTYFVFQVWGF